MQFKGLFVGETCTGTGPVQTLEGAYALEAGVNTIPFADAYADGAIVPFVLLASNRVDRLEGQAVFDSAGTMTLSPWVIWNGTTYETYDGSGFTLPAGIHRIWVGVGQFSIHGSSPYSSVNRDGSTMQVADNILRADSFQDFNGTNNAFFGPLFYASSVLFNRLTMWIDTVGGSGAEVQGAIYEGRNKTIFQSDCGDPGKALAKASFDGEIAGLQLSSVPLQILPAGRYWSGSWSNDATVKAWRCQERTHAGPWGIYRFNNGGVSSLELEGLPGGLPDDLSTQTLSREAPFRSHIVGLAYVPD